MKQREFKLGDKVYCTKRNLNGIIMDFQKNYFIVEYENKSYGKYTQKTLLERFLLFEESSRMQNIIFVDFINKRIAG